MNSSVPISEKQTTAGFESQPETQLHYQKPHHAPKCCLHQSHPIPLGEQRVHNHGEERLVLADGLRGLVGQGNRHLIHQLQNLVIKVLARAPVYAGRRSIQNLIVIDAINKRS